MATSATMDRSQRSAGRRAAADAHPIHDHQLAALRKGLLDAGLAPKHLPVPGVLHRAQPA